MTTTESDDRVHGLPVLVANVSVAALIIYVASRPIVHALHHHFFLEPDSIGYLSLGDNIWQGKGFVDFTGDWCSDWPPFYPFVVGLCKLLTHDSASALGLVGGLSLASTLTAAYYFLGKLTKSYLLRIVVAIALAFSVPLTNLANSGLSESLFVPLTLVCLLLIGFFLHSPKRSTLMAAAFTALLCCMTRYIGTTMVAAALLAIAVSPKRSYTQKLVDCITFASIALIPFFGWCTLNKQFTGSFMGDREIANNGLHACIDATWACIQDWLIVPWFPLVLASLAIIGMISWLTMRRGEFLPFFSTAPFFVLLYGGVMVWSSARYNIDMIDDRLMAPLFVPTILIAIGLIEHFRESLVKPVSFSFVSAMVAFFSVIVVESAASPQIPTGGYLSGAWQKSRTLAYVSKTYFDQPLASNDSAATFLLGHKEADWVADDTDSPTMPYVESQLNQLPDRSYVVWLYNAIEPTNFNVNMITSQCHLKIVATFSDGIIFQRNDDSNIAGSVL